MKKIISLILSCAVLASLFSFPVSADTGTGTSSAVAAPILYESFDSCDFGSYGGKVIKPEKYIHIGHDEIYTYGKCEKCKKIPLEKEGDSFTVKIDSLERWRIKTILL